jgi:hypothetical protein
MFRQSPASKSNGNHCTLFGDKKEAFLKVSFLSRVFPRESPSSPQYANAAWDTLRY